jgi:hypothetical protein
VIYTHVHSRADFLPGQFQIGSTAPNVTPDPNRIANAVKDWRECMRFDALYNEFIWRSDGTHEGSNRTEAIVPGTKPEHPFYVEPGDVRYIGASYRLNPDYPWRQNKTIMQIGMLPNPTAGSFYCGLLFFGQQNELMCSGGSRIWKPPLTEWFRPVAKVRFQPPDDPNDASALRIGRGSIEIIVGGQAVLSGTGRATMGTAGAYGKVGSYGTPIPNTVSRLYIADLIVADTYAEAAMLDPPPLATDSIESVTVAMKSGRQIKLP